MSRCEYCDSTWDRLLQAVYFWLFASSLAIGSVFYQLGYRRAAHWVFTHLVLWCIGGIGAHTDMRCTCPSRTGERV